MTPNRPTASLSLACLLLGVAAIALAACASPTPGQPTASGEPEVTATTPPQVLAQISPPTVGAPDATSAAVPDTAASGPPDARVAQIATPDADAAPPSVRALGPYFSEPPLDGALRAYLAGDNHAAAKTFEAFVQANPEDVRAQPARLMALLSRHDGGVYTPTAADLEEVSVQWPLLKDYALFYAGSSHYHAGATDHAERVLKAIGTDSTLWERAQELRAKALEAADKPTEALAVLEHAVERVPDERSTLWMSLQRLSIEAGDAKRAQEAVIELAIRFARQPEGRAAYKSLGDDVALTAKQRFRLGTALHKAHRHSDAVTVLSAIDAKDPNWCEARYMVARTQERRKRRTEAWAAYKAALKCKGQVQADATFAGGRNRLQADDYKTAKKLLKQHILDPLAGTTVDDAVVLLAEAQRSAGQHALADKTLLGLLRDHPKGDQREAAAWSLVWPRLESSQDEDTLAMIDKVIAAVGAHPLDDEGRIAYWRGQVLASLKRTDEAVLAWRGVVETTPLTWYAVLAQSRLRMHDPKAADAFVAELVAKAPAYEDPLKQIPAGLWRTNAFRKAVELARLGLGESAERELSEVPSRIAAADPKADAWTRVALYDVAGATYLGTRIARRRSADYEGTWPIDGNETMWRLAYPRPYRELVDTWADARSIDPLWVWSVMRTESNFNPKAESWANAIGLMQIILPTADFLSKGTDIEPTRANLQKPEVALELGTKYLAKLLEQHVSIPLASAGYNAGGGSVRRWRRAFGEVELDAFVERMTFREARRYARRVTSTLARYMWLYRDRAVLTLDLSAPGAP